MLNLLNHWFPPYVSPRSFAASVNARDRQGNVTLQELDMACLRLAERIQFDAVFHQITEVVTEVKPEPVEGDFKEIADFEIAMEEWAENEYDAKPWYRSNVQSCEITAFLLEKLQWSINNKLYPIPQLNGTTEFIAFSRQPAENMLVEQLEFEHQNCVKKFASNVGMLFSGQSKCQLFQTNHLLNLDDVGDDDDFACFFDETFVIADEKHIASLWIGHERWYG